MNLFCFSLEGSMDSLYEAVQNSGDGPTLPVPSRSSSRSCSRSCSPAVLLDDNAKWRGSGRSISMEISQMQGGISKKKTKRTHISKSASGIEALDNHGSNTAAWQPSRTREDLSHVANGQNEELAKAKHRVEAKVGKGGRHPGTKKKEKSMPRQTGSYEGWKPGQEWPPGMQRDGSVHANRVATEPRPAVKRGQKAGKKTGGKSGKEGSKKSHNSTVHAPPGPVTAPHLDISYRSDRRPYLGKASTLPAQENYTPGRGSDMSILSGGATLPSHNHHHQRLSNPAESSPVWTDAKHTCRRPLTEYRLYSQDLPLPRDQDWEGKAALATAKDERSKPDPKSQVSPMMPRSITDVDLSEPNRTTSFGRFETHRHQQPSPAKLEEGTTALEEAETLEPHKSVGLAKKMKVISLTMRRKMGKKHAKSFSEEMGNDGDRDPEAEAAAGVPAEKEHAKTNNSLESLNSGQSSSSGVTSESNSSSQRDSLRLEEDGSYHGQFCSRARVHTDFVPSPYDTDSLKLKVGDIISIISKPPMGIWTGMLNNKVGNFKFIYVEVLVEKEKEEETPKIRQQKLCRRPRPKTLLELLECLHLEEYASALLLNGYQTVEDLMHLQEKHLIELNVKDPEHRHKLLTAAEYRYTGDDVRDGEEPKSSDGPREEDSDCPRDSGCFIPSECSETHIKEDGEPLTHSAET